MSNEPINTVFNEYSVFVHIMYRLVTIIEDVL